MYLRSFFITFSARTHKVDLNQDGHSVGPDLGPNWLQTIKATASKEIIATVHTLSLGFARPVNPGIIVT